MTALKVTWIKRILTSKHKWKTLLSGASPLINRLENVGSNIPTNKMNQFWKDVFSAYKAFGLCIKLKKPEEILAEPIFYNDKFTIGKKVIIYNQWLSKNISQVSDLISPIGKFLTHKEFTEKFGVECIFLDYYSCIEAIRTYIRKSRLYIKDNVAPTYHNTILMIRSVLKGSKKYYDILTSNDYIPNFKKKWEQKLNCNINWLSTLISIANIKEVKLKWFQIRILHRIIASNTILHSMGITPNDKCSFCNEEKENIQHLFYNCTFVTQFWNNLKSIMSDHNLYKEQCNFSESLLILGYDPNIILSKVSLYIILVARYFIYKCKLEGLLPQISNFKIYINSKYKVEKYNAGIRGELESFSQKWEPWNFLVNDT